jgi:hypothetical protein
MHNHTLGHSLVATIKTEHRRNAFDMSMHCDDYGIASRVLQAMIMDQATPETPSILKNGRTLN